MNADPFVLTTPLTIKKVSWRAWSGQRVTRFATSIGFDQGRLSLFIGDRCFKFDPSDERVTIATIYDRMAPDLDALAEVGAR